MLEEVHFVTIRNKNMVHLTHTRYFTFYIQTPSTRQWYFVQSQSISRNATIATSVYLVSTDLVIHRQWQNVVSQINKKNKKLNKKTPFSWIIATLLFCGEATTPVKISICALVVSLLFGSNRVWKCFLYFPRGSFQNAFISD